MRFFSLAQISRHWWGSEEGATLRAANRRLRALCEQKVFAQKSVSVVPELSLKGPVFLWEPGQKAPHFGKLSWQLQRRWSGTPVPTKIYEIGQAGLSELGGRKGGPKRIAHIRHDLHMGTVYLALVEADSTVKNRWVSEDELAPHRKHQKLPDGMIRKTETEPTTVIEFGGAYDAEHVESFHRDCESRELNYQIW